MGGATSTLPNLSELTLKSGISESRDGTTTRTTASSTTIAKDKAVNLRPNEKEIIKLMLPVYFVATDPTAAEIQQASHAWELILNDKSPEFLRRKETDPTFPHSSCMIFFYDTFYTRLFDMHPMCRHLFVSGIKIQGRFLVKMITLSLAVLEDSLKFDQALIKLAQGHYHAGVKSVECKLHLFLDLICTVVYSFSFRWNCW